MAQVWTLARNFPRSLIAPIGPLLFVDTPSQPICHPIPNAARRAVVYPSRSFPNFPCPAPYFPPQFFMVQFRRGTFVPLATLILIPRSRFRFLRLIPPVRKCPAELLPPHFEVQVYSSRSHYSSRKSLSPAPFPPASLGVRWHLAPPTFFEAPWHTIPPPHPFISRLVYLFHLFPLFYP